MNLLLAITFIHTAEACVVSLVVGAIAGYLVLRNNKKVKADLDADVAKIAPPK